MFGQLVLCNYIAALISNLIFIALHGMQTRSSGDNSVTGLSVHLCVKCVLCDKTKESCAVPAFLYRMKDHLPQFRDKKNGWWGRPLLPEILGQPAPMERNRRF